MLPPRREHGHGAVASEAVPAPVGEIARASSSTSSTSATSAAAEEGAETGDVHGAREGAVPPREEPRTCGRVAGERHPGSVHPGERLKMERLRIGSGLRGGRRRPRRAARSARARRQLRRPRSASSATAAAWAGRSARRTPRARRGARPPARGRGRGRRAARVHTELVLQRPRRQRPARRSPRILASPRSGRWPDAASSSSWSTQRHTASGSRGTCGGSRPPRSAPCRAARAPGSRPARVRGAAGNERGGELESSAAAPARRLLDHDRQDLMRSAAPRPAAADEAGAPAPSTEAMFGEGKAVRRGSDDERRPVLDASRVRENRFAVRAVPAARERPRSR